MIKWTIKYTDFDDVERTEEHWFSLTQSELMEMNFSQAGGLDKALNGIVAAQDGKKIMELFKEIILKSYGEKSPDGKRFIKTSDGHRLAEDFEQSAAYDALFMELATDEKKATEFITGIIPRSLAAQLPTT